MDDLISRQAAIDALCDNCDNAQAICPHYPCKQFTAIDALTPAQPESKWIPCSERLPNKNGIYIVTRRISDGFECRNITDACYFDGSDTWHDDTRVNHGRKYLIDVLAWREMPEPYRKEGD